MISIHNPNQGPTANNKSNVRKPGWANTENNTRCRRRLDVTETPERRVDVEARAAVTVPLNRPRYGRHGAEGLAELYNEIRLVKGSRHAHDDRINDSGISTHRLAIDADCGSLLFTI